MKYSWTNKIVIFYSSIPKLPHTPIVLLCETREHAFDSSYFSLICRFKELPPYLLGQA
jgi:hypothetical protein